MKRGIRPPGTWILLALIAVGMGIPALYRWAAVKLKDDRETLLAGASSLPEARLAQWLEFGAPQIHHALEMARFSDRQPWYVTHVVAPASANEPPSIFGIDFTALPKDVARQDGMLVRVVLEAPVLLARDVLVGDRALGVPVFQPDAPAPDGRALALKRLVPYLEYLGRGLVRDIPGARIVIEVGGLKEEDPGSQGTAQDG